MLAVLRAIVSKLMAIPLTSGDQLAIWNPAIFILFYFLMLEKTSFRLVSIYWRVWRAWEAKTWL